MLTSTNNSLVINFNYLKAKKDINGLQPKIKKMKKNALHIAILGAMPEEVAYILKIIKNVRKKSFW